MTYHLVLLGVSSDYRDTEAKIAILKSRDKHCEVALMLPAGSPVSVPANTMSFSGSAVSILRTVFDRELATFVSVYPSGFIPSLSPLPAGITKPVTARLDVPEYGASTPWAMCGVDVETLELKDLPSNGSEAVGVFLHTKYTDESRISGVSQFSPRFCNYHADKCIRMSAELKKQYRFRRWDESVSEANQVAASEIIPSVDAGDPSAVTKANEMSWQCHTAGKSLLPYEFKLDAGVLVPSGAVQYVGKYPWCYYA